MTSTDASRLDDLSTTNTVGVNIMVVQLAVCAIGVVANLTVIIVILILREYRKTLTHWYVLQLAIADCAFLLIIPFDYSESVHGAWIYSNIMCKAKETVLFLNYHSSILFLVVMSVDRYLAVCHSRSEIQSKLRTRRISIIATLVVWGLSLIFCIPIMMYSTKIQIPETESCGCGYLFPHDYRSMCKQDPYLSEIFESTDKCAEYLHAEITAMQDACVSGKVPSRVDDYEYDNSGTSAGLSGSGSGNETFSGLSSIPTEVPSDLRTCNYNHRGPGWFAYLRFLFIGMFVIPLLIMGYCYTCIVRQLHRTRIRQTAVNGEERSSISRRSSRKRRLSTSSQKANKKIARVNITCILLVVTFIVCWLPFHSHHMAMMNGIHASEQFCANFLKATSLLIFLNSALNPLIYNFIGTKFSIRARKAAVTLKSSIRRASVSSTRGTLIRYKRRQTSSRNSSHGITINTAANRSLSSSNGYRTTANWSMVAMPGSTADPEQQMKLPLNSTVSEAHDC